MTAGDALDAAVTAIEAAGCPTPKLDAELLIADALGVDRARLYMDPDMEVPPAAARVIGERVRRRVAREPVAYILGRKGFRHLELAIDRRAIIPRPETELLVDVAGGQPAGAHVHDVGTGAGAIALALLDERPDLHVTASEPYAPAAAVARENAARLGLPLEVSDEFGLPEGDYDLVVANLPYVPEGEWERLQPEIRRYEPREAFLSGEDGLDAIRELIAAAPSGTQVALEHGNARDARRRLVVPRPGELGADHRGAGALRPDDVATFERCIAVGGVALFPADTVYGLATEPDSRDGVDRLYRLKRRRPDRPAAVMFFRLELALAALPELGGRTRWAIERLLPGAVTLLLPNPARRYPLACGPDPSRLGLRVPHLRGPLAPLAGVSWPVLQSSANLSGGADARRVEDVDEHIRAGVDLILDGGELPGTPSTVVDLTAYENGGRYEIVREGALPSDEVERSLA
jgi:L-threonylcarbamoyladenylate synthase